MHGPRRRTSVGRTWRWGRVYAHRVSEYVIRFIAVNVDDLDDAAYARLVEAAKTMPGIRLVGEVMVDAQTRRLDVRFAIPVEQAMAEAARDGGRLAKEILLSARIPDARLVEMTVRMVDPEADGWTGTDDGEENN